MWQLLKPFMLFVAIGFPFCALLTLLVVWLDQRPIKARSSRRLLTIRVSEPE